MTDAAMVSLFKAELELCKVVPGQTLAVLSEGETRADYAQAFLLAAQQLGATSFHVNLPPRMQFGGFAGNMGKTSLAGNQPAIEALKGADIVIDLMFLLFSEEQIEITNSGTRMLLVLEPLEVLIRMLPNEDLRRRVEFGQQLLQPAGGAGPAQRKPTRMCFMGAGRPWRAAGRVTPGKSSQEPPFTIFCFLSHSVKYSAETAFSLERWCSRPMPLKNSETASRKS